MGIKGGAAGGGYADSTMMEEHQPSFHRGYACTI